MKRVRRADRRIAALLATFILPTQAFAEADWWSFTFDLRKAGSIAEELQMRPLRAHSHLGLARLYATADQPADAARHLEAAKALYRELNMVHCLQRADVAAAPRED